MLIFESSGPNREIARLGAVMIGEVALNPGGRRVQAWARIYLPGVPNNQALPATSLAAAKRILSKKVDDWLEAAELKTREPDNWGWMP